MDLEISAKSTTAKLIDKKEVQRRLGGCSRAFVDKLEKDGDLPKSIKIGMKKTLWVEAEIEEFINKLIIERENN